MVLFFRSGLLSMDDPIRPRKHIFEGIPCALRQPEEKTQVGGAGAGLLVLCAGATGTQKRVTRCTGFAN